MSESDIELLKHRQEIAGRYANALQGFAALSEQFCKVIDERDQVNRHDFLERLDHFLPLVYAASRLLPTPWEWYLPDDDDHDDEDAEDEVEDDDPQGDGEIDLGGVEEFARKLDLQGDLEELLGSLNFYDTIFDPYSHLGGNPDAGPPAMKHSLADDIASIDEVLRFNLDKFRLNTIGMIFQAAWGWRFELDGHLGRHITNAIRSVWSLVNDHADDLWEDTSEPDLGAR